MRYRIRRFDKRGDPIGPPQHVPDNSPEVPAKKVRTLLHEPDVEAIELHFTDGTSVEIAERCK